MSEEETVGTEDEAYLPLRISEFQCEIRSGKIIEQETRAER
ncbi:MAG TPA: hypothetical protein VF089_13640 [Candidatus Binatia bacterium]